MDSPCSCGHFEKRLAIVAIWFQSYERLKEDFSLTTFWCRTTPNTFKYSDCRNWCPATILGVLLWGWCDLWRLHDFIHVPILLEAVALLPINCTLSLSIAEKVDIWKVNVKTPTMVFYERIRWTVILIKFWHNFFNECLLWFTSQGPVWAFMCINI